MSKRSRQPPVAGQNPTANPDLEDDETDGEDEEEGASKDEPSASAQDEAPPAPAEPALDKTGWGQIHLRPGTHIINGDTVEVPEEEGKDWVWHHLPAGKHVVDKVITHVHPGLPKD